MIDRKMVEGFKAKIQEAAGGARLTDRMLDDIGSSILTTVTASMMQAINELKTGHDND